ncbi:hypothetical protein U1Q18_043728 [Sarracenia purpurea var. burkii]
MDPFPCFLGKHLPQLWRVEDPKSVLPVCALLMKSGIFKREQWPGHMSPSFLQISSVRDAYLALHTALQQFKFIDPLTANFFTEAKLYNLLFLNKNDIIFWQVSESGDSWVGFVF